MRRRLDARGEERRRVVVELTEKEWKGIDRYAAEGWPRRPDGGDYRGRAVAALVRLGIRYVRDVIEGRVADGLEELATPQACREENLRVLTEEEARGLPLWPEPRADSRYQGIRTRGPARHRRRTAL